MIASTVIQLLVADFLLVTSLQTGSRSERIIPYKRSPLAPSTLCLACGLALLTCLGVPPIALANSHNAEEMGPQIALEARKHDQGYGDFTAGQTIVLRNKQGQESRRNLRIKVMEVDGECAKSMFLFDEPRDIESTAFPVHAHRNEPDHQWPNLLALIGVKQINSSNRSGSFMGSRFALEDVSVPAVEICTYRYLGHKPCGEPTYNVTERVPEDRKSGYSRRRLVWQDKDKFRTWNVVEWCDRKNEHPKTRTLPNYDLYSDQYWYATETAIVHHLKGKSTVLTCANYQSRIVLDEIGFSRAVLRRAR